MSMHEPSNEAQPPSEPTSRPRKEESATPAEASQNVSNDQRAWAAYKRVEPRYSAANRRLGQ